MFTLALAAAVAPAAEVSYDAAVSLRQAGRTSEAIAALEALSRSNPADADVWLHLGLAHTAARDYAAADRALERALQIAPAYGDARIAYARSAFFRGEPDLARQRLAPLLAAEPQNPEARALAAQLEGAAPAAAVATDAQAWRLDVSGAYSDLTQGLDPWYAGTLALSRRVGERTFGGVIEHTERFGVTDTFLEAFAASRLGASGDGYVALGGAPDADYRAEVSLRAGGSAQVWRGEAASLRLGLDGSYARFGVGDVRSLQPYLVLDWTGRATLTLRSINTLDEQDEYRSGYAVRADVQPVAGLRFNAGWADAPESSEGVTVEVQAVSAGFAVDLNEATTVSVTGVHEMRRSYDRNELTLALSRRF